MEQTSKGVTNTTEILEKVSAIEAEETVKVIMAKKLSYKWQTPNHRTKKLKDH